MSLFEAYNQQQTQQSYVPQQRANLQTAYNQALGQRTPNWAIHLSNAMPSIAEIIAAGTTKGAFNQGRIADSLERQKNRQIAYTQALQNMEDNRVKDYVQMAKDQLNLDIANEQEAYNRDLTTQQLAYKKLQDEIANKLNEDKFNFAKEQAEQAQKNFEKEYNLKLDAVNNKPAELTEEEKLQNEIKKLEAIENAKAKIEANKELGKTNAEYNAFKSQLGELNELSKQSGNSFSRAFGAVTNPLTGGKTNLAANELKSKVLQALYTAKGYDTDKINPQTSKDLLKQVGMPSSGYPTQAQMKIIIDNIDNIYKQRIASQQNFANSFNSVSWE